MFNNKPIILKGLNAAVFLARMECHDQHPEVLRKQHWKQVEFDKQYETIHEDKITRIKVRPEYIPLTVEESEEKQKIKDEADQFENIWVYNYLKENYPKTEYARQFAEAEKLDLERN